MTARVILQLHSDQPETSTLLVPRDALSKNNKVDTVWVIKSKGTSHRVYPITVSTGRIYRNQVEILSSELQFGQQVVTRGNETLKSGQQVIITPRP
jgi:multidrug efflux pump subunit AcrA (membrane-fusion protein)